MKKVLLIVGISVVLFLAWAMLRTPSPEEKERGYASRAIDLCWQDQKRKSLPPDQARFIAGACEKMGNEYKTKFGRSP